MSQQPRSIVSSVLAFIGGSDPIYRDRGPVAIIRLLVMVSFYYAISSVLINFWPAWRSGYQVYFRGLGNAAFEQFLIWPEASVRFLDLNSPRIVEDIRDEMRKVILAGPLPDKFPVPARDPAKVKDTLLVLKNRAPNPPEIGMLRTGSQLIGYWPLATILALSLATPWIWRRKTWVLMWSLLLVHVFIVFRLSVFMMKGSFADPKKRIRLVDLGDFWFAKLQRFDDVLNDDPTINFIAPVLLWLVVVVAMELWPAAWQKIGGKFKSSRRSRELRRAKGNLIPNFKRSRR